MRRTLLCVGAGGGNMTVVPLQQCSWVSGPGFIATTAFLNAATVGVLSEVMTASANAIFVDEHNLTTELTNNSSGGFIVGANKTELVQQLTALRPGAISENHVGSVDDYTPIATAAVGGYTVLAGDHDELVNAVLAAVPVRYLLSHEEEVAYYADQKKWLTQMRMYIGRRIKELK